MGTREFIAGYRTRRMNMLPHCKGIGLEDRFQSESSLIKFKRKYADIK